MNKYSTFCCAQELFAKKESVHFQVASFDYSKKFVCLTKMEIWWVFLHNIIMPIVQSLSSIFWLSTLGSKNRL